MTRCYEQDIEIGIPGVAGFEYYFARRDRRPLAAQSQRRAVAPATDGTSTAESARSHRSPLSRKVSANSRCRRSVRKQMDAARDEALRLLSTEPFDEAAYDQQ